jgi:Kef-type K+ transport system membrane component KefB
MIGVVMGGRGALEFILIQSGLEKGLLNEEQFSVVIIVTLLTILLTPVFYRLVKNRVEKDNEGEDLLAQD